MTVAFTNHSGEQSSSYGASPLSISLTTVPTVDRRLAVGVYLNIDVPDIALTDNQGNTYTLQNTFIENGDKYMFYSQVLSGTMPTSLSVSWTGGGSRLAYAYSVEVSGAHTITPIGTTGNSTTGYGETESITYSTSNANEGVFCFTSIQSSKDFLVSEAGYTRAPTGAVSKALITNNDVGTSGGGKTVTMTWTGADHCVIGLVTFIPATTGGSSGTISVTLSQFISSISGTTTIVGNISNNLNVFTGNLVGTTTVSGIFSSVLNVFSSSITATTSIIGSISSILNSFIGVLSGTTTVIGSMGTTLGGFISSMYDTIGGAIKRFLALMGVGN